MQVNRHLRELDRVAAHHHSFNQIIVCLAGRGYQLLEQGGWPVRAGTISSLPSGCLHSFRETGTTRPLCLVIDFEREPKTEQDVEGVATSGQLPDAELAELKGHLSHLMRLSTKGGGHSDMQSHGRILLALDLCLRRSGMADQRDKSSRIKQTMATPIERSVLRLLQDPANYHRPLSELASRVGYQPGYLNRRLKESCGLTLGQLRAQRILAEAEKRLVRGLRVGEVAAALGFTDQNYFARWFKRQTGNPPTYHRR